MIDWIKFSERQPEKKALYLCAYGGKYIVCSWIPDRSGYFWTYNADKDRCQLIPINPDYWAEINPPGRSAPLILKRGMRLHSYSPGPHKYIDPEGCACCDNIASSQANIDNSSYLLCQKHLREIIDLQTWLEAPPPA